MKMKLTLIILAMATISLACTKQESKPEEIKNGKTVSEINYGNDHCAFTNDEIKVVRYGGKIEMKSGEVLKFMSVECVAGYYLGLKDKNQIKTMRIVDFAEGKQLLPVDELVYLNSSLRPSPNGMNLTAVDKSNEKMKSYIYDAYPGDFLSWKEVLAKVSAEWNLDKNSTASMTIQN